LGCFTQFFKLGTKCTEVIHYVQSKSFSVKSTPTFYHQITKKLTLIWELVTRTWSTK
jgi:hypothetical protein